MQSVLLGRLGVVLDLGAQRVLGTREEAPAQFDAEDDAGGAQVGGGRRRALLASMLDTVAVAPRPSYVQTVHGAHADLVGAGVDTDHLQLAAGCPPGRD